MKFHGKESKQLLMTSIIKHKKKAIVCISFVGLLTFLLFWTDPRVKQFGTIKIWDRNHVLLYESAGSVGKKIPVAYDRLPRHLIDAAIASEDASFWSNPGVDIVAIVRSLWLNVKAGNIVSGASTITQQLARAVVIAPQKTPSRSVIRKIREALVALRLNSTYSKKDILTMYLNTMYFGNVSYGIQAAVSTYFDKDVSQLSLAQSAFLIGLLSSPDRRNPFSNMEKALGRQSHVLSLMEKHGVISRETADDARLEEIVLAKKQTTIKAPHFVQYVIQEVEAMGLNRKEGIHVYTTLDYPALALSQDIASAWVSKLRDAHDLSNAALVLLDNESGAMLSMLGGVDYFDATNAGQVNMTVAPRQPGSALKPVTYATAFMDGFTPATLLYDVKTVYRTKKGEGFTPHNYDGRYHGLVLAREALASSLNLPAVEMLNRIGLSRFLSVAKDLGITTLTEEDRYDLALTLGGGEVTLLELTNVYATLARGGLYKPPYTIQNITSDNGVILYEHRDESGKQTLGPNGEQISYVVTDILADPKARIPGFGEKNPLVLSHPAAVKTGTTTDWHDNWTVGYTPSYTVGVWIGNNDNHPMRQITGVTGAAPLWNQFFEEFLKGKPVERFIRPDGITEREICALSGKLPDRLCPEVVTEIFVDGSEPKEQSNLHKKVKIDRRNNLRAGDACPSFVVTERVFIDYPPEVYSWAVENDQDVMPREFSPLCPGDQPSVGETYLELIYPKEGTVFETAPLLLVREAIVFEVNVSSDIESVRWYVDGALVKETTAFPFSASWIPKKGTHIIHARGMTDIGADIRSNDVGITVVEFKGEQ